MNYTTSSNFKNKTTQEHFEDIYCRINKLENNMLGIKKDNKSTDINIIANLDLNKDKAVENIHEVKEEIEDLRDLLDELELPDIRPIINFYGCSFNFGDGFAEAAYHMGDNN
jgi:hypothetical protein